MFGIGIIGCGKIAQVRHIPEYAAHPEAKLVGFYDINQQRAAELAAKYGGCVPLRGENRDFGGQFPICADIADFHF